MDRVKLSYKRSLLQRNLLFLFIMFECLFMWRTTT